MQLSVFTTSPDSYIARLKGAYKLADQPLAIDGFELKMSNNPYAIYVNCDGAMDYKKGNPGGIGFAINFPESSELTPIAFSIGTYFRGNIERLEIEALIQAIKETHRVIQSRPAVLKNVNTIIFITDRLGLVEGRKTSSYQIRDWRKNGWKNHEGKPIKNHRLLDELDKEKKKLAATARIRVDIEWRRRKENKKADKLAKTGKQIGLPILKLWKKSEKIGRRKFSGSEVNYSQLKPRDEIHINIFRKDPVQDEWEICAEICAGKNVGNKFKIYSDDSLAEKLKRGNEFIVRIKTVYRAHVKVFRVLKKPKKGVEAETISNPTQPSN